MSLSHLTTYKEEIFTYLEEEFLNIKLPKPSLVKKKRFTLQNI